MHFTCAFLQNLLINHLRTNMRMFCPTVIGTLHKQTDSTLHLLNILDILTVNNVYRHNALKFLHLWHKRLPKGIIPKSFSICKEYSWIQHQICSQQIYVNLECAMTGKQTIAKKMKADLNETIENLDKGTWKSSLKVPL